MVSYITVDHVLYHDVWADAIYIENNDQEEVIIHKSHVG